MKWPNLGPLMCPSSETLEHFARGRVGERTFEHTVEHLEDCMDCRIELMLLEEKIFEEKNGITLREALQALQRI